jgi:predicted ATPase/signal transduction histidine kinase/tRNA A-37 threonylcarbamoyl transferase component Bud32
MLALNGIKAINLIYESANSLVYCGVREKDGQAVILKLLKEDYPTPSELTRYKQEYEITKSLDIEGAVKAYSLEPYQRTLVITLEDFGGISLKKLLEEGEIGNKKKAVPVLEFIKIAIKITESLRAIHAANIIHKDINPANIVFNRETGQVKIIDFGISTVLSRENPTLKNPNVLEGTLAYISPEQTGRMNRSLDYRTDFYSLGVTFYELLAGKLPFEANDALELVHSHIAKQAIPPREINPEIPDFLSAMVMKLMAKTSEERYQSAYGIKVDLEAGLRQLENGADNPEITLGLQDISDKFQIPQKLYGRQEEIETLLTAFDRIATGKSRIEMMLVAGYSGIGKSSLVAEVYKPITEKRGYFIAGKFEQFQRNVPYSAVVHAFRGLIQQLLTETEAELQIWREKLLAALGVNGQIIIDVIPEVELIVGQQPAVPQLGPTESLNRFNLVFQNFLEVFGSSKHPLVIFLDDLQWADSASLKLIELMMADEQTQYLFLIGAYRDNEVNATHPLIMTLEELREEGAIINGIVLEPLDNNSLNQLIADTLHSHTESVASLAELVLEKTGGNPFFVNEFIKSLYQENLLVFDVAGNPRKWRWDVRKIEAVGFTDNVVELTIAKLKRLPDSTREVLPLAACLGTEFDLNTLAIACEKLPAEIYRELVVAVQLGFIFPTSELDEELLIKNYKFAHDRIQQAAYALIDEERTKAINLKIGRLLLQTREEKERTEKIFEIADRFNVGRSLITDKSELLELAKLNLLAGKQAKDATAYVAAREYLMAGVGGLTDEGWNHNYQMAFDLHKERAEVEYLNGNLETSEELINLILQRANSPLDKAEIYNQLIIQYTLMAKYADAIEAGRKALALLGVDLPKTDLKNALAVEVELGKRNLGDRSIPSLIDEPEIEIPEQKMVGKLLINIDPPAYFSNQELYAVVVGKMANLSLTYGHIAESAKGYVTYGIIMGSVLGDYKSGYEFGCLAVSLSDKFNSQFQKCAACLVLGGHLNHWVKHIKFAKNIFDDSYQAGLSSGELRHSGYALEHQLRYLFYQGINLEKLRELVPNYLHFSRKTNNQWGTDGMLGFQLALWNLLGMTKGKLDFHSDEFNDVEYLDNCRAHNSFAWLCTFNIFKSQILYLYDEPAAALDCALEAGKYIDFVLGHFQGSEYNFYYSLILAALYPEAAEERKQQYWQQLEINQKQMKTWADNCPENFLHKYLLIAAEMARISGKDLEAMELYDRSIESAKENQFVQNEALANELAAKFWLAKGKEEFAKIYLKNARYGYQIWGAKRKVEDLEAKYRDLLRESDSQKKRKKYATTTTAIATTTGSGEALDLATVMKAARAISGEIVLGKLLEKLMQILLENVGGQSGHLILCQAGEMSVEASKEIESQNISVLQSLPIESCLPVSVINYVARTKESLVLNNAKREGNFTQDAYIQKHQTQSILCAPLIDRGQLVSIVYLENNLSPGAFTKERLEVVKILSSQAAISIENARLYASLETKVAERTQELSETLDHLKATQEELVQSEKMAALGQLVAGVAHEINTPLGAIGSSINNIASFLKETLQESYLFFQELSPERQQDFFALVETSLQRETSFSTREKRQFRKTLKGQLEAEEIEDADSIAQILVSMGIYEDISPFLPLLKDKNGLTILNQANQLSNVQISTRTIKTAADRAGKVVFALKSFARYDSSGEKVKANIIDGIETVLTLYQNQFKQGVDAVRNYLDTPSIYCYPDELNQIWTNLVHNALQAMGYKGTLTIDVGVEGANVQVKMTDTGAGIPEEIMSKIFEPFFTTKPPGEGSGLGLDIVKKIVAKHEGKIEVASQPGKTTFTVLLPINPENKKEEINREQTDNFMRR